MKICKIKIKKLLITLKKKTGKNNSGKIFLRHKGGGTTNLHRIIDFKRFLTFSALILKQENVIERTATIALILYKNGTLAYILSTYLLKNGDIINVANTKTIGSIILLKNVYVGAILHSLELKPGAGAKYCRAAGCFFQILNLIRYKKSKKKNAFNTF